MRKILISITAIMAILVLTSCSTNSSVDKKTLNVGILQIVPHGSLDAARKGFKEELNKEG